MAELNNTPEEDEAHTFPAKRKPDLPLQSEPLSGDESSAKKQKSVNNSEDIVDEEEEEDYEGEDEDDNDESDDDDEEEEEEERLNGKGKGIMKEDKGKGKMIEQSDDDSDESSDAFESDFEDDDSDLSDDPLAEVDLDNILPSRTRRCGTRPGLSIRSDKDDNDV